MRKTTKKVESRIMRRTANKTVNGLGLISSFAVFLPSYLVTEDLVYDPDQLDRAVVTPDQIRTVVRTYKDKVLTEIFPGRTWVPKMLINKYA